VKILQQVQKPVVAVLFIVTLGLIAYSNTFHNPFVFDDEPSIIDNPVIKKIDNFFLNESGYRYNPRRFIGYLTFAVNYHLGGLDVTGYHLFNIAVHLMNALLVFSLVRLSFRTPVLKDSSLSDSANAIAFLSALLFVVHPVQTQAVTYIVQRLTSLAVLFSLGALWFYVRWRLALESGRSPARSLPLYLLSILSIILAMKTKEISFTLPILIVLYDMFFFGKSKPGYLVPVLLTLIIIPFDVLNVAKPLGAIISDVSTATRVKSDLSRWDYLITQFVVIVTYLRLLLLPVNQNLDYDYPSYHSLLTPRVFLSFLVLISLFALAIVLFFRSRRETREKGAHLKLISFGILWFFITLSVESSIIPITDVIFEHRIYFPSVGFFIALSAGAIAAAQAFERKMPRLKSSLVTGMVVLSLILGGATWLRNQVWKDDTRLWEDVVAKSPAKGRPFYNLGLSYDRKGKTKEAFDNYVTSIRLDPYNPRARDNLGNLYAKAGRYEEAIKEFRISMDLDPDSAVAYNNLGNVFAMMGRREEAMREFKAALQMDPGYPEAHFNMGNLMKEQGMADGAEREYHEALRLKPEYVDARINLGILYGRQGRIDEAIGQFQAALKYAPDDPVVHQNLAMAFQLKGLLNKADEHRRRAQALKGHE